MTIPSGITSTSAFQILEKAPSGTQNTWKVRREERLQDLVKPRLIFFVRKENLKGAQEARSTISAGLVRDLDAKMKEFGEAGIRILSQPRSIGSIKYAYIEDQWGTKIEVLQDAGHLGFHHVHIYTTDPETTRDWYKDVFGGRTISYLGSITALDYGAAKLFFRGQARITQIAPSEGRSLDHIGFSVANLDTAAEKIKEKGVIFTEEH